MLCWVVAHCKYLIIWHSYVYHEVWYYSFISEFQDVASYCWATNAITPSEGLGQHFAPCITARYACDTQNICSGGVLIELFSWDPWLEGVRACVSACVSMSRDKTSLNNYFGHLQAWPPAINIKNFGLVAVYHPDAQLVCKTKVHHPDCGYHTHSPHWETSLLRPLSPA